MTMAGLPALVLALVLMACGGPPDAVERASDDVAGARDEAAPAADSPVRADTGVAGETGGVDRDSAPAADGPPDTTGTWTAGRSSARRDVTGVATLRDVRTARHGGFDRVVLDFGDGAIPSWEVEYVDRPVRQCGSGDAVEIAGDGWLRIHVQPARGHDDEGRATVLERRRRPDLPVLAELVATCDFEAHVEWVAGVRSPNRYRVLELAAPARLVVDIRH
jgi:hypothetical protein